VLHLALAHMRVFGLRLVLHLAFVHMRVVGWLLWTDALPAPSAGANVPNQTKEIPDEMKRIIVDFI